MGDLFERDLLLVSVGQAAVISAAAYPGQPFSGRVDYISGTIDPATRTAKIRVSVVNSGGRLKAEMFATVSLDVSRGERAVTVPSRALFTEDHSTYVYTQVDDARFARRRVEVAQRGDATARVASGLAAGDRVVVAGAILLRQEEEQRAQ